MNCPFCAEEIKDEAVVCRHCQRDLSIPRPIMIQLRDQAAQIADLRRDLDGLRARGDVWTDGGAMLSAPHLGLPISPLAKATGAAFVTLLVAHFLIVWTLDLHRIWLLLATLTVPFVGTALWPATGRATLPALLLHAGGLGVVSVAAMTIVSAAGDLASALPNGRQEWLSEIGWTASVALSFATGALAHRAIGGGPNRTLGERVLDEMEGLLDKPSQRIKRFMEIGTPVMTSVGAVVTGVQSLLR